MRSTIHVKSRKEIYWLHWLRKSMNSVLNVELLMTKLGASVVVNVASLISALGLNFLWCLSHLIFFCYGTSRNIVVQTVTFAFKELCYVSGLFSENQQISQVSKSARDQCHMMAVLCAQAARRADLRG